MGLRIGPSSQAGTPPGVGVTSFATAVWVSPFAVSYEVADLTVRFSCRLVASVRGTYVVIVVR